MPDTTPRPCPACGGLPTIACPYDAPAHYVWAHCCPVLHRMLDDERAYPTWDAAIEGWHALAARLPQE